MTTPDLNNETPFTDDLSDFSIHAGERDKGMSIEQWLNENKRGSYTVDGRYQGFMLPEYAVREFVKGKVLVPWLSLRIAHDCLEDFIRDYGKTPTDDPETRKRLMQSYDNALQDIRTALRPTSSGVKGNG